MKPRPAMFALRKSALAIALSAVDRWAAQLPRLLGPVLAGPVLFGVMVGAAVFAMQNPALAPQLDANRPREGDVWRALADVLAASAAFVLVTGLVHRLEKRDQSDQGLLETASSVGRRLSPLLALPFVVALRSPAVELDHPERTLVFIALAALACARGAYALEWPAPGGLPPALPRWGDGVRRVVVSLALVALWGGYAYVFSRLSITQHHALKTRVFDVGLYDNVFYQSSHGVPLGSSFLRGGTHASAHFDPLLVLLSPLYLVHPRAELLLALQSVWLGAGVVPVYLIARRKLESRWAGGVLAVSYAIYPALHGANLCELHSLSLLSPLLLWILYLLEAGAHRAYFAVVLLALLCREDVPLVLCFVGLYALCDPRPRWVRVGWVTIVGSLAYFVIVKTWLMRSGEFFNDGPRSYGYAFYFGNLIPNNHGLRDLVLSLVTNPTFVVRDVLTEHKILFVLVLFTPLAFLPLVARPGRVMLLYGAVFCLLATDPAVTSVNFYYASVVFPVAFAIAPAGLVGAVEGLLRAPLGLDRRRLTRAMLATILVAGVLVSWKFGAIVDNRAFRGPTGPIVRTLSDAQAETYAWVEATVRRIPKGASLGVTVRTGAHASNRRSVAFYPRDPVPDYLFIHEDDLAPEDARRHRDAVLSGLLVEVARREHMVLLRRAEAP